MWRRCLNGLYQLSGALAALCLVIVCGLIVAQMVARQLHSHIPSSGDFIALFLVWSAFLGLAYTMYYQAHIRVELVLSRFGPVTRRYIDAAVALLAVAMLLVFAYFVYQMIGEAFEFDDVTDGEIPLPLGWVQVPMLVGLGLFTLSMLDYAWLRLHGQYFKNLNLEQGEGG